MVIKRKAALRRPSCNGSANAESESFPTDYFFGIFVGVIFDGSVRFFKTSGGGVFGPVSPLPPHPVAAKVIAAKTVPSNICFEYCFMSIILV